MSSVLNKAIMLLYCLVYYIETISTDENLRVIRSWINLEYAFSNETVRQQAISNGDYVVGNSLPIDVDAYYGSGTTPRIFITIPRFVGGIPITLGTVDEQGRISAYPDYSWNDNQGSNCEGITSVFRVAIDRCDRLWVMDSGKVSDNQTCPPQLLAFDLKTNNLIRRFKVNRSSYTSTSLFLNPVVDINGNNCADTFVYVADSMGFSILVVDLANNDSWLITNRYLYPIPSQGRFTIEGTTFYYMEGVLGMALSPYKVGQDRILYSHALASNIETSISTSALKNRSLITSGTKISNLGDYPFKVLPGTRPNQSAAEAMDNSGILYFGLMSPPSIFCWNSETKFNRYNFHQISINRTTLQFSSGMKIVNSKNGQELWAITNSFQKYATATLSNSTINFRMLQGNISTLLRNSPCRA